VPAHSEQNVPHISGSRLRDKWKVVVCLKKIGPYEYHRLVGNGEWDMSSAQNSSTQPEERPESRSLRKVTTLRRMTEPIAKELNECLCVIVVNASTCLRMLAAEPPNVEGARETARRTIRSSSLAAEAVSRLSSLFIEKK